MKKEKPLKVEAEVIEEKGLNVSFTPAEIEANFASLDEHVSEIVAGYADASYDLTSQETIKQAKRDRTYLNSIVKEIDERRKAVKREYMRPYNEFEAKANAITKKVKDASNNIKNQLDEAEENRKAELFDQLKQHYEDFAGVLVPLVPYERIHDPKWLNKTFGLIKAQNAIEEKTSKIASDWETLKSQSEMKHFDTAERTFFETLDLGEALNAAREAQEADMRIAELHEAVDTISEEAPEPETELVPEPEPEPVLQAPEPAPIASAPITPQPVAEPAPMPVEPAPMPHQQVRIPCVMVIEAASPDQMHQIGGFCGSLTPPVTGRFIGGTIEQAFAKLQQEGVYRG